MLVPDGGVDDAGLWRQVPKWSKDFLVPVKRVALRFRPLFTRGARRVLSTGIRLPYVPAHKGWVVFTKPAVQGADRVLQYLGRYIQETAITDRAIRHCDERTVTFRYYESQSSQSRTLRLPGHEFLRRFLQHVLPKGFHRVRDYGLLHPFHRRILQRVQLLLGQLPPVPRVAPGKAIRCPYCKTGHLVLLRRAHAGGVSHPRPPSCGSPPRAAFMSELFRCILQGGLSHFGAGMYTCVYLSAPLGIHPALPSISTHDYCKRRVIASLLTGRLVGETPPHHHALAPAT